MLTTTDLPARATPLSTAAGLIGAACMVLSAPAHSLLGWPELAAQLARTNAPADLVAGLAIGWHFGGAAMVAFGVVAGHVFLRRMRREPGSVLPAWTVAVLYLGFGLAALVASGFDPFFAVFIVPGLLVALGLLT